MNTRCNNPLLSNFIALSIVQGTNFLLPLLVMPYVLKKIGTEAFGTIAVAQVLMVYLSVVSDYGFNLTATRDIARFSNDQLKTSRIFFTVLASKLMICAFLFVLLWVSAAFIPAFKNHFTLYTLGFTYVVGQSLLVSWFFQGKEKMHYITVSTLISRLVFVVLVLLFIRHREDGVYFLLFLGIGNVVAGLCSIYLAIRVFKLLPVQPAWKDMVHEIKEGWQITVSNLSINTYMYSGIFILRIFTNDLVVGYYSIAERIFFAARQVLAVFSQAVYPRICQLSMQGQNAMALFFKKVYLPFLLLVLAGCSVLCIFSSQLIGIFLPVPAPLAVLLLRMLSFVPFIVCLNIPAYQLLLAFNHRKSYLAILGAATLVNTCTNLILVKEMGATGTALSIVITELFITVGLSRELYKHKQAGYIIPGSA